MKDLRQCSQIRAACTDVREDYRPPVTFVVVQKRHHTRLFPMSSREGDKSGNVMPGAHADAVPAALSAPHCIDKSQCNPQGIHVMTTLG
jgi:Piwi domain